MADELVISGLLIEKETGDENVAKTLSLEVDAVFETDFRSFRDGQANLSLPELCAEIEFLGSAHFIESPDRVASAIADGMMELFPQVSAIEITVRVPDPTLPGAKAASIGARLRRRREPERKLQSIQAGKRPRPMRGS
ncbi:hypothetical protein BH23CHL5_BH23CHL5_15610 [soil metagenome]